MNMNEKKDYIIQMVKLIDNERVLTYMITFLQMELKEENKKGLINSP